jgi:Aspartyl protease
MTPKQIPAQSAHTIAFNGRVNMLLGKVTFFEAASDHSKPAEFPAIWDTGATNSVITQAVVDALGLAPTGVIQAHTPQGSHLANTYLVDLTFPGSGMDFKGFKVSLGKLTGFEALIGMDIIGFGDFAVTNKDGKTVMSFRVPSMERTDYVQKVSNQQKNRWITPNGKRKRKH